MFIHTFYNTILCSYKHAMLQEEIDLHCKTADDGPCYIPYSVMHKRAKIHAFNIYSIYVHLCI